MKRHFFLSPAWVEGLASVGGGTVKEGGEGGDGLTARVEWNWYLKREEREGRQLAVPCHDRATYP